MMLLVGIVFRNSLLLQSEFVVISWYIELELSKVIVDIKTLRRRKPNFYYKFYWMPELLIVQCQTNSFLL